jgi:hypothetical protein
MRLPSETNLRPLSLRFGAHLGCCTPIKRSVNAFLIVQPELAELSLEIKRIPKNI